jgi:hypothetical protein
MIGLFDKVIVRTCQSRLAISIEGYVKAPLRGRRDIDKLRRPRQVRGRSLLRPMCEDRLVSDGRDLSRVATILIAIATRLERDQEGGDNNESDPGLRESVN